MLLRHFSRNCLGRKRSIPWTTVSTHRLVHSNTPDQKSTFEQYSLHANLCKALHESGIHKPTSIQRKSINAVLSGHNILCLAQTGTGKTLSYMIPIIEKIKRSESAKLRETQAAPLISRPRVLIAVPSRELALQLGSVAKQLAHHVKFASCVVTNGEHKKVQQQKLARPIDILIGTPGRIVTCIKKQDFYLSQIDTLILDEADTLFDAKMGFIDDLKAILAPIQASCHKRECKLQSILVAATATKSVGRVWNRMFEGIKLVSDNQFNRIPKEIKQTFVRVAPQAKYTVLRDALEQHRGRGKAKFQRTIIFCNDIASCQAAEHMLRQNGFKTASLHKDVPKPIRQAAIQNFDSGSVPVLVCTDLGGRGLDIDSIEHVIMLDFPRSVIDYIHRVGRTGRAGKAGYVTSFMTKGDTTVYRMLQKSMRDAEKKTHPLISDASSLKHLQVFREDTTSNDKKRVKPDRESTLTVRKKRVQGTKKLSSYKRRVTRSRVKARQ
uniref:DEAD/DEAH box RNA helicase putative n=1 Tax=Albugo laibachii Nc14 TaxID=890382 RepID=F0WEP4_9STRA|nr:DEAD/DEAH box RNA helicase putative [Albugo laibachii Nc14]|eukprot:CCA19676.1 DEAD/DEAH box RNA helicase putative [Albugo laibachii Nc14]